MVEVYRDPKLSPHKNPQEMWNAAPKTTRGYCGSCNDYAYLGYGYCKGCFLTVAVEVIKGNFSLHTPPSSF